MDADVARLVARLKAHATENPVTVERIRRMVAGLEGPIGADPDYRVVIPDGYRCVYSEEEQPMGLSRHLSVSVVRRPQDSPGVMPSPESVAIVMALFGFSARIAALIVAPEIKPEGQVWGPVLDRKRRRGQRN